MSSTQRVSEDGHLEPWTPQMILQDLSDEFDAECAKRHEAGAEKYGPLKFTGVDTLDQALEEILDLANYARYTYIKVRMLQLSIQDLLHGAPEPEVPQGFISLRRD